MRSKSIRPLTTSSILRLATPVTGPTLIKEQPNPQGSLNDVSTLDKQSAEKMHSSYPEEFTAYPDYSKGPSALDKASQLFFFTEILRGEHIHFLIEISYG
jgi:NADH dehydrogenase (ubiquinone) Fe-S protein 8